MVCFLAKINDIYKHRRLCCVFENILHFVVNYCQIARNILRFDKFSLRSLFLHYPRVLFMILSLILYQFFESSGNFSGPESDSKILNLKITKLFYSQILNMNSSYKEFQAHALLRFS